jgi:diguanylate cyclase (GGDEF)-like protein
LCASLRVGGNLWQRLSGRAPGTIRLYSSGAAMTAELIRLFVTGCDTPGLRDALAASSFGPFVVETAPNLVELAQAMSGHPDAVAIVDGQEALGQPVAQRALARLASESAVLVRLEGEDPVAWVSLLRAGVEDVLSASELALPTVARRLRSAAERKRRIREARTAYATDLSTGLPHQQQLIEHMSHLMALREREPAPMAVLVLRIEGLATAEARQGREAAQVLRRKLAVRLRAGVRASDVVAFIGADTFAVLLASILAPADAERVGAKLLAALQEPFNVSGRDLAVATALGIGHYPEDGKQPDVLLRKAIALAAAMPALGRTGHANFAESVGLPVAANDD